MIVVSVNIGKEKSIRSKSGTTGIYKAPVLEPVVVGSLGLDQDVIIDTENHGGVDQAVYVYGTTDYTWWSEQLNRSLEPGTFGENLTISDLESSTLSIGDQFHIHDVILEVTSPRIPCVTLATRMNDPQFVKKFVQAKRYGAYCRVIKTGTLQVGNNIKLNPYTDIQVNINEMADAFYNQPIAKSDLERFLSVPVAVRARTDYEQELAKLNT